MLAKSETVSADLRAKPETTDHRAEADAIARGLAMLFQIIFFLHPVGCGHRDDLADRSCGCARAIAVPVERLRLTPAVPAPIARGFAGQLLERGNEGGLGGVAKVSAASKFGRSWGRSFCKFRYLGSNDQFDGAG